MPRWAASTRSTSPSTASSLKAVLRPVTLTKAILAIGFLTMVAGELSNQARFGWLAALTLACAWLVDAFVTPAFMSGLRIVTLWDTLRLDLDQERLCDAYPAIAARVFLSLNRLQAERQAKKP